MSFVINRPPATGGGASKSVVSPPTKTSSFRWGAPPETARQGAAPAADAQRGTIALAAAAHIQQAAALLRQSEKDPDSADHHQSLLADGLHNFLHESCRGAPIHRWVAVMGLVWELCQVLSFSLSGSPALAWTASSDLSNMATVFQVISFGYYIPNTGTLATGQFAFAFSIALLTVILAAMLAVATHPALGDKRVEAKLLSKCMRLLLAGLSQWWYLPVIMQLLVPFRCSATTPFLRFDTCWGGTHTALTVVSAMLLLPIICLAAVAVLTIHDHSIVSKHPHARPHGRMLLIVQLLKLALAVLFALDMVVSPWVLNIGAVILQTGACFVFVMYLPFYWQFMNRCFASGYAVAVTASMVLVLGTAQISNMSDTLGWNLLFVTPFSAITGYCLSWLQWEHAYHIANATVANVYQLELVVRRLLQAPQTDSVLDQADALFAQGLQHFANSGIIHMFVAQYLADVRNNQHLERGHLQALRLRDGPIDETFHAARRVRQISEQVAASDRLNVANRLRFDKLKEELHAKTLAARRLQVAFWTEVVHANPSLFKMLDTANSLRDTMRHCDQSFQQLLSLNPTSVNVTLLYAQFAREVANDMVKSSELLESAAELETLQARAQGAEVDVLFMALQPPVDANQDNVGLVSISSLPTNLGAITEANSVFLQMTGYSKRELLGSNVKMLIPEPIASMHQHYLEVYQETGRGMMINSTHTLFLVHKAGHILPVLQTMRPLDNVINAVAVPVVAADFFLLVALPSRKVTGMCQRSMSTAHVTAVQLKDAAVSIEQLLPAFAELLEQHRSYMAQYEEQALTAADLMPAGFDLAEQLCAPVDVVYKSQMQVYHESRSVVDATMINITLKLQLVKVTGALVVLIRWQPVEALEQTGIPATLQQHRDSLAGSEMSDAESVNSATAFLSPVHVTPAVVGSSSQSSDGDSPVPALEKGVRFSDAPDKPAAPGAEQEVHRSPNKTASKPVSDRSSHGSSGSASTYMVLQRALKRVQQKPSPAVRVLNCNLVVLMATAVLILIANCIVAAVIMQHTQAIRSQVTLVASRLLAAQASALRFQDLVLHTSGFAPLSGDTVRQRMAEIAANLDTFDALHHVLYTQSQTDAGANAMYTTSTVTLYSKDAFGRIHKKLDNSLNAGVSFVSEGRLALQGSVQSMTNNNTHIWFVQTNMDTLLDNLDNFLDYYMLSAVSTLQATEHIRTYILFAVIILFFLLCTAVIVPSILRLHNVRKSLFQPMLDVPFPVLRALRQQAESWLEAALRAVHEQEEDELDDETDPAEAVTAAVNGSLRPGTALSSDRHFRQEYLRFAAWLILVMCGPLLSFGVFVGLYFWGDSVAAAAGSFVVESYLASQLSVDPQMSFLKTRDAMVTANMSQSASMWAGVQATYVDLRVDVHAVMFGTAAGYPAEARSVLRLPDGATLFNVNGCLGQASADCQQFYHGLLRSGLQPATEQFIGLLSAAAMEAADTSSRLGHLDVPSIRALFAAEAMLACDEMAHTYLVQGFQQCEAIISATAQAAMDDYVSSLATVTAVCILGMLILFWVLYRPMLVAVNVQLQAAREILLLFPEPVLRTVPSMKQLLKQLQHGIH